MKNLVLGYKKEKILKDVNLGIKGGEFIGIIGPSGAGKSTLMMSVVGGIKVFDGKFKVLGHDMDGIKKKKLRKIREQIGIIFQGIMHPKVKTTKSNILIPPTYDTTCNFFTPFETKLLTA